MVTLPELPSVAEWKKVILEKGMGESLADHLLLDLDGYDYNNIGHRRDVRRLATLFAAMQEMAAEAYSKNS